MAKQAKNNVKPAALAGGNEAKTAELPERLKSIAAGYFKTIESAKELHVTPDGFVFLKKGDAQMHARTTNSEVYTFARNEVEPADESGENTED